MQSQACYLAFVFLSTLLLHGCANFAEHSGNSARHSLTPVSETPSGETYPGKFIWHDLVTPDARLAGKFYEQLFGWQIEYHEQYAVVRNGGRLIAGILQVEPTEGQAREALWMPSVSVTDVDAAVELVRANGGTILNGPVDMDLRGRAVLISDPQRADLVLLSARGGDPVDAEAAIGDWLWDEIWTDDPEVIEAFYATVLGYDQMVSGDGYDVFMFQGKWRAGMRHLQNKNEHMLWVPVVRVADPQAIVERVEEIGGVVWVTPDQAPDKGNTALIADTTGALLLIQRWPPQTPTGEL